MFWIEESSGPVSKRNPIATRVSRETAKIPTSSATDRTSMRRMENGLDASGGASIP